MAISQNFPTVRPTLNLNFARSKTLDPRITFTRSSIGTYVDEDGLIKTAAADQARFDYDPETGESLGLLIEESRTNLVTYNTAIGTTGWTVSPQSNTFVTQNYGIAPDGTQTASRVYKDALDGSNLNLIYTQGSFITVASQKYAISAFVKVLSGPTIVNMEWDPNNFAGGRSRVYFDLDNLTTSESHFNTNPGSSIDGSGIEVFPNGWYRVYFYVTVQSSGGLGTNGAIIQLNRYVTTTSDTLWWGVQAENATFHTSFIKTEANHVTRSADTAQITGNNFSSWYNQSEGTIYTEASAAEVTDPYVAEIVGSDGSGNNLIALGISNLYNQFRANSNGSQVVTIIASATAPNTFYKQSAGIAVNNFALSMNGGSVVSDTSSPLPTVNLANLNIGYSQFTTSRYLNGHIYRLAYYPERLTNSQLQNLTK